MGVLDQQQLCAVVAAGFAETEDWISGFKFIFKFFKVKSQK